MNNVQKLKLQFGEGPEARPSSSPSVRTQIPVARFGFTGRSPLNSSSSTDCLTYNGVPSSPLSPPPAAAAVVDKWRAKFEDTERRRKTLLAQNQKRELHKYIGYSEVQWWRSCTVLYPYHKRLKSVCYNRTI